MEIKKITTFGISFLILSTGTVLAQQQVPVSLQDTVSEFQPAALFSPVFYTSPGNERNASNGAPGASYWQNRCDYRIDAVLDTAQNTLMASERITYTNNSHDSLSYIWFQLDQNTYRPDARSNFNTDSTPRDHTTGYMLDSIFLQYDNHLEKAEYIIADTRMQIRLTHTLFPKGGQLKLFIHYHYTVPGAFGGRTDYFKTKNGKIYEIAQWFPRLCVYDARMGWNTLPFLGSGEFYLDYGDIDYRITVPWNMIVAASGELMNPREVLTGEQIQRLNKAKNSDQTLMIRSPEEINDPHSRPKQMGKLTWHFRMTNTRDVAFGASSAYVWDAAGVNLPEGKKCMAMSVYPIESNGHDAWSRATEYLKASIEYFSKKWFVYPYPVAVNEAGIAGGMEYPGIVYDGWKDKGRDLYAVTAHEIGHNWFPMIVGSNERLFGWMDEGLNTFIDIYASDEFHQGEYAPKRDGEYAPGGGNPAEEILKVLRDPEAPVIMSAADAVDEKYRHPITYYKTAFGLVLLREQILGKDRFDYAFRKYIQTWCYKHPTPDDFFRSMENAAGEDLSWFWREWFFHNWEFDPALVSAKYTGNDYTQGVDIRILNKKQMALPFTLALKFKNGTSRRMTIPVEAWLYRKEISFHAELSSALESVTIDPDAVLPDANRENNSFVIIP
jgi:hypothetical protein